MLLNRVVGRGRQPGQAMVVAVLSLTALLAFSALVINFGLFLVERRNVQNAADAAAMAGAWQVLEESSRCYQHSLVAQAVDDLTGGLGLDLGGTDDLAMQYVDEAGNLLPDPTLGFFSPSATGVRVTVTREFDTWLPSFAGRSIIDVSAESESRYVPVAHPSTLVNPVPLAAAASSFALGSTYDLYSPAFRPILDLRSPQSTGVARSNWAPSYGVLDYQYWSDGKAPTHTSGMVGVGDQVALEENDERLNIRQGLLDRVSHQGLSCLGISYTLLGVPLYDQYTPKPNPGLPAKVRISGFGWLKLTQAEILLNGALQLNGTWVAYVHDPASTSRTSGPRWGPSVIALTQ